MEQTVNPEAIRGFLRDYRSRAYAHDHGHGYSQTSYLPGYTSSSTPRWAQPVTGNEVLRLDDYTEYEDDEDDRRSEYTTAPTVVSRRSSRTSTSRSHLQGDKGARAEDGPGRWWGNHDTKDHSHPPQLPRRVSV